MKPEHPYKRRRPHAWRVSRLRRLMCEVRSGRATARQRARVAQLQRQLEPFALAACLRPHSLTVEDRALAADVIELCWQGA